MLETNKIENIKLTSFSFCSAVKARTGIDKIAIAQIVTLQRIFNWKLIPALNSSIQVWITMQMLLKQNRQNSLASDKGFVTKTNVVRVRSSNNAIRSNAMLQI